MKLGERERYQLETERDRGVIRTVSVSRLHAAGYKKPWTQRPHNREAERERIVHRSGKRQRTHERSIQGRQTAQLLISRERYEAGPERTKQGQSIPETTPLRLPGGRKNGEAIRQTEKKGDLWLGLLSSFTSPLLPSSTRAEDDRHCATGCRKERGRKRGAFSSSVLHPSAAVLPLPSGCGETSIIVEKDACFIGCS